MITRRLLVAEDDPNDRVLIRRALARAALADRVDFVTDGQEAVDFLEGLAKTPGREWPVVVVLDLKMPRLDGLEVLAWIRRSEHGAVPVVLLTSSSEPSDIRRAYAAGVNAFVVKPSALDAFTHAVSELGSFWVNTNAPPVR